MMLGVWPGACGGSHSSTPTGPGCASAVVLLTPSWLSCALTHEITDHRPGHRSGHRPLKAHAIVSAWFVGQSKTGG